MKKHPTYVKHTIYTKFHYNMQLGAHTCVSKHIKMSPNGPQSEEKENIKFHPLPGKKEEETTSINITLPHMKNSSC